MRADPHLEGRAGTGAATVRLPHWAVGWGPAVVAFAAVRVYLLIVAAAHGLDGRSTGTWTRWDSYQYLLLSQDGYTFWVSNGHNSRARPGTPLGTAGWMPGYPLLIRAAAAAGAPPAAAGLCLSAAFALGLLRGIGQLLPAEVPRRRRLAVLLLAAFFPGFVYVHAVFPVGLAVLLLAVSVRVTAEGRWTRGGMIGAAAAFTYTSGYLIGPVMGLWSLLGARGERSARGAGARACRMFGPALLPPVGLGCVLLMQRVQLGRWDGLFRVQSHFHSLSSNAVRELCHLVWLSSFVHLPMGRAMLQVPVVTLVWAVAVGGVAWRWARQSPLDRLLALAAFAYWVGALQVGTALHPWRAMALLTPFVPPLCRRLPMGVLWAVLAAFLLLGWAMCGRFFDTTAI